MAELRIQKGATVIILPEWERKYTQGWIDFEVTERTINRTLVSDFIAFKRRFGITWNILDGNTMAALIDLYLAKEDVTFHERQPNGTFRTWTCRLQISEGILREIEIGNYAFSGFAITLEEV
ncbi:MAG: hypothetical protein C0436_00070 [Alphaproteobacteria bacterium]|nr:hypothetical protein [Alphaproteobacteria bacterium]